MGRHPEGRPVHVRIPDDVLDEIDTIATDTDTNRAAVIRDLLRKALTT